MQDSKLRTVRVFSGIGTDLLADIECYGEFVSRRPGEMIVTQGDPADAIYFLVDGRAAVYTTDPSGGQNHLYTIEKGGHFGEIGLLEPGGKRTANVRAAGPCELFRIPASGFEELKKNPNLGVPFLSGLCRSLAIRLADVTGRLSEVWSNKSAWNI